MDDVDDALAYRDDAELARFLPHIPQPFTRRDAEAFIATNMSEPGQRSPTFAIVLDGELIGTVNFEVSPAQGSLWLPGRRLQQLVISSRSRDRLLEAAPSLSARS